MDKKQQNVNVQFELKDSVKLSHIRNQFYKSPDGHLFELTSADREVSGVDTLVSAKYFNGKIPQDIDPLTFEELNGWYAKDKNHAYLYRPTSEGILIVKLDSADVKSFGILKGHYNFASDKNHVYNESKLVHGIDPANLKIVTDDKGFVVKIISGKNSYMPY